VLAISVLLLIANLIRSRKHGALAGRNPWGADTLEWAAASPPEPYNFYNLPTVSGRYGLWTRTQQQPVVVGLRTDRREMLVTQLLDAEPDHRVEVPGPTLFPLLSALATGVLFIVSIFSPWGVVIGAGLLAAALVGWYWPRVPFKDEVAPEQPAGGRSREPSADDDEVGQTDQASAPPSAAQLQVAHLPSEAFGSRAPLWWGVVGMVTIESTMFALLFVSYFYLRDRAVDWPPTPIPATPRLIAGIATLLLVLSCIPMHLSSVGAKRGSLKLMRHGIGWGVLLAAAFWGLRYYELSMLPFRWDSHAHGSLFWTLSVLHLVHALTSCLESVLMLLVLFRGPVEEKQLVDISINTVYWYFVVGSAVAIFALLYLDPMVLAR
jgi:heme/copper-type cytochrome/quinol oxidase subunit 3